MELRDYFAAKAMQAHINLDGGDFESEFVDDFLDMKIIAQTSYMMADAMLAERQKDIDGRNE